MKAFDVLSKQEFTNNGELQKLWHRIGIIKLTKKGGMYLQLFQFPNMDYYVVEPKEKETPTQMLDIEQKED